MSPGYTELHYVHLCLGGGSQTDTHYFFVGLEVLCAYDVVEVRALRQLYGCGVCGVVHVLVSALFLDNCMSVACVN